MMMMMMMMMMMGVVGMSEPATGMHRVRRRH